jgi:hypothetical protein
MSGTPQLPKLGLDARAAELKEKLLKGRSQTQTQSRAAPARPSTDASSKPANTFSNSTASLPADADDIAALISSISSASEVSGSSNRINSSSDKQPHPSTPQPKPASEQIPPQTSQKISIPTTPALAQDKQPSRQLDRGVIPAIATPLKPRNPVNGSVGEGEKTKTVTNNIKATEPAASTVRAAPRTADHADRKSSVANIASGTHHFQSVKASDTNSGRESGREKTVQTPTKPVLQGLSRDSEINSSTIVPKSAPSTEPTKTANNRTAADQAVASKNTGGSEQPSSDDAFTRLLSQVPDLKDFLEMTDYYNVEARTRKLDRFRRAKALAAERLRIEEEERKLMEEEELEMGLQRSTAARLTSAVPSAPAGSGSNSLPTPVTPMAPSMGENKDAPTANPAKRAHDEESTEVRQEKVPRLETPPRPKDTDSKPLEHEQRDARDARDSRRGSSPHRRAPSPRQSSRRSRSPPARPRYHADYDDYESRSSRKPDRYRENDDYHHSSERRVSYPVRVDLGRKGGQYPSHSYH